MHFYDHHRKKLYRGDGSTSELKATELIAQNEWRVVERDGSLVHTFDSAGRHLSTQLGLTGTIIYQMSYNSQGNLTQIQATHGRVIQFVRNSNGDLTKIVGFKGEETLIELDASGYLSKITNPQNESYEMTYSSGGLLQTFQKPTGALNTFIYDTKGNLAKDQMPGGAFWDLVKGYQGAKPYSEITSALGAKTRVEIWDKNNVFQRKTIHPNGVEELDIYEKDKMRNQGAGPLRSTIFVEDPRFGNGVQYVSSQTHHTKITNTQQDFVLSDVNNPFSIQSGTLTTTIGSNVFQTLYDGTLKKFTTTSPVGRVNTRKIDSYERVTETQSGTDLPIFSNYTSDKLTSIQQGSRTQSFQYHTVTDLLDSVTNALNQTTSYVYDSAQRLRSVILPDLRQVQYNYNSIGQVTSITPANGKVHTFNFGSNEKESNYIPPYLANNVVTQTLYSYDLDNRVSQIQRPTGEQILYNYDPTTTLLNSITTPQGNYQQYFAPSQNKYTTFIAPSGMMTFHNYVGGFLSSETIMGASAPDTALYLIRNSDFNINQDYIYVMSSGAYSQINYTYDNDSLLTQAGDLTIIRDSQNPRINSTVLGQVEDFYTYNSYGEVIGYEAKFNNIPVYQLSLTRDLLGRVLTKTETMNSVTKVWSYTYDVTGRLTHVSFNGTPRSTYNYDANSNRTSGNINGVQFSTTIDDQDRMLQFGLNDYKYNLNGEMTEKLNTLTQVSRSFACDVFGNTISTTKNSDTTDYIFDSFHRRTLKKLNGTLQEKYVYLDQLRLGAVITAAGQIAKRFVYGSKSNVPDYLIAGTEKYRIISDNLGSPRLVIRVSDGQVMQRMNHDEFGRVIEDTNPGFTPFGFAGGIYDVETGLVRFGARDYDAEIGRWLSKDPILFNGGDTNLYGYVNNDPINGIDPTGLKTTVIITTDFGVSSHAAVHVTNGGNPVLYDPSGSYLNSRRGSGDTFGGGDASLGSFAQYHGNLGSGVQLIELNTTPVQEAAIVNNIYNRGGGGFFGCASSVSNVLGMCGINPTSFPGNLGDQARGKGGKCK